MKLMKYRRISNRGDYPQSVLVQNHFLIMLFSLCLVFHPLFMFPPSPIASLKQWNHHMNHKYTYNTYLCWSMSSQQNFETEKLAEFCETKEVYVETKTSPGTWRESGIAESSHLSGALIYFFEWSSYLFFWVELLFIKFSEDKATLKDKENTPS